MQLQATLVDIDGDPLPTQPVFQYTTSDAGIVTVNASGLAQSVGPPGSAMVSAQGGA